MQERDLLKTLAGALLLASSFLLAVPVHADVVRFGDKVTFSVGAMNHNGDGYISSTRPNLPLDRVTFKDLDLDDDDNIFWGNINWQISNRWQLGISYSEFETTGLTVASTAGNFEGIEWEVGAALASSLDVKFVIVDVSYDFLQKDNGHLGLGVGLHGADLDFDLLVGVFATVGGGSVEFFPLAFEEASVLAPMPNVSLVGGYTFADKVYLEGRVGWFSMSYDKYNGDLLSLRLSAEWRPWKRVGIGAGYQYVDVDVKSEGSRGNEFFDLKFDGPMLFVSVGF